MWIARTVRSTCPSSPRMLQKRPWRCKRCRRKTRALPARPTWVRCSKPSSTTKINTRGAMTKSELIAILSERHTTLKPKDAEFAVKTMLDAMAKALATGDRIEIRGFGSFGLNHRPPRTGRNPKTGEKDLVPEKFVPHFKAGKELRERVDFEE